MRFKSHSGLFFLFISTFGCISPPADFPSVPRISFESIEFVSLPGPDSLIIDVKFQDAEGDLGLSSTDILPPFNALEFQRNTFGSLVTYSKRPPQAPKFNPVDWVIDPIINNQIVRDTLWVKQNPNQYNIFVKFFIKRNGRFNEFKWSDPPFFTTFNGRFPRILATQEGQPVEGNIRYGMLSSGWQSIFRNDTIKIEVEIQDRLLNRSNQVSSPEVTLPQITRVRP